MTDQNNITRNPLSDGAQLTPADGQGAVAQKAISLEALEKALGKDFGGDPEKAVKAIQDTFSYVGKRKEDIAKEVSDTLAKPAIDEVNALKSRLDGIEVERFYKENPQYAEFRPLLTRIGGNPAEAVRSPEIAPLLEKANKASEMAQNRSVIHSNPRIAQTSTKFQQAETLVKEGEQSSDTVADILADAVWEAKA